MAVDSNTMWKRREFITASSFAGFTACNSSPRLIIGSKDSVESRLLGEIVAQLLEKKLQARLERRLGTPGPASVYQALQGGDMDIYPEYSRLAYKLLLKIEEQADSDLIFQNLKKGLATNAQASCLPFLGFENVYTAVVLADNLNFASIRTLSQAAANEKGWRIGCTTDFAISPEGLTDVKDRYKLDERIVTRHEPVNQLFFGLRDRRIDLLFTGSTDPRLSDKRYRVLADDLQLFSPNHCTLVYRNEPMTKYPMVVPVLATLSGKLDSLTMRNLNGEIELNKRGFAEVASEWLTAGKFI